MTIISFASALIGVLGLILLGVLTKKREGIEYARLDRISQILNILLTVLYVWFGPAVMFIGMVSYPYQEGFLAILGWIIAFIIAAAPAVAGVGIGLSIAWRKKGRTNAGFYVQFAGLVAMALAVLLYVVFVGNLLAPLN